MLEGFVTQSGLWIWAVSIKTISLIMLASLFSRAADNKQSGFYWFLDLKLLTGG